MDNVQTLDTDIVNTIIYDAKGQRIRVQYENGTTTIYEYDPLTYRVTRIKTTRYSDSKVLQDLLYWYDAVGNITMQKDNALQSVYYNNSVADPSNEYTYDALYRLIEVRGRELAGNNGAVTHNDSSRSLKDAVPFLNNTVDPTNAAAMRRYTQYYEYDSVGNMLSMQHTVTGGTGNWTRNFTIDSSSNRLAGSSIGSNGSSSETYTYDDRGNMIGGMNHLNAGSASMIYNALNRLEKVTIDSNTTAHYQYDGGGQRVRKTIVNSSATINETRKYVGSWEVYTKNVSGTDTLQRETLHVADDTGRIALIDTPTIDTLSTGEVQLLRYQYSNHLGTATLELDDDAAIISYEEYYPYGSTSFQSGRSAAEVSLKRYRYTGKERDEETGLNYHGARYYAPWLCRWVAVDPLESKYAGWSSYNYCTCNPINHTDSTGMGNDNDKPPQNVNGYTVKTVILDTEGNVMPEGTTLPYNENYTNTALTEHKKNLDKGEVEAGTQVLRQAKGEGGMETITVTYRMGWGAKEGKPLLWGYQNNFTPHEEPALEQEQSVVLSEPTPTKENQLKFDNIPPIDTAKSKLKSKGIVIPPPPPPPPTGLRIVSSNTIIGGGIWRADMSQEGYKFMLNLVKELKQTNLGSIDITFGIPANMNRGVVIHSDEGRQENINPKTKRVTSQRPGILRVVQATGNMDVRNVEAQGKELKDELQRRLKVPVYLDYRYNSQDVLFRFTPKRK